MPVLLSDETWVRISKMLDDYESGVLRVIPGYGLKLEEQTTSKSNCPGTRIGTSLNINIPNFSTLNLNVCIGGVPTAKTFLTVIGG